MILALLSLAAAQTAADPLPFLTITRSASGIPTTQIEVGVLPGAGEQHYWFRRVESGQGDITIGWTDTQNCAGVRDSVVLAAADVTPPEVAIPGVPITEDGSFTLTLDGVLYSFEAGSHYGGNISSSIRFTSNVGTPLSRYVEDSITALEPCWSGEMPAALANQVQPSPE